MSERTAAYHWEGNTDEALALVPDGYCPTLTCEHVMKWKCVLHKKHYHSFNWVWGIGGSPALAVYAALERLRDE